MPGREGDTDKIIDALVHTFDREAARDKESLKKLRESVQKNICDDKTFYKTQKRTVYSLKQTTLKGVVAAAL
jgi:hypothetical protein